MSKKTLSVDVPSGTYVVAVSGGVDSMVLLDLLRKRDDIELIVAHFNHGIRGDSSQKDAELVQQFCKKHGLRYEVGSGKLGSEASEATARKARYQFLESVRSKHKAQAVITAHHRDDLLETAIINLLRGTRHRGLTSLQSRRGLLRPLLGHHKSELIAYAEQNKIEWREDESNIDQTYLRNYIRHSIIPKLSDRLRSTLLSAIDRQRKIDPQLAQSMHSVFAYAVADDSIIRSRFVQLPHAISSELIREILHRRDIRNISETNIEAIVRFCKTGLIGKRFEVSKKWNIESEKDRLRFVSSKF